jgi:NADH:ubiquinone oxidoreductase subunit 5 (subunit L)/multisubunit Na+/H+ antiporter MnhA subunit
MPTPVSALLHAATLVTAGIYLLLRSSPILEYSPDALLVIVIIGSSTAFFAGTCGLLGNDLKRIIAFSTISQLGYISLLILLGFLFYSLYLELDTSTLHISNLNVIQNSIVPLNLSRKLFEGKVK